MSFPPLPWRFPAGLLWLASCISVLEGLTCDTHFIAWEINFSILMLGLGRLGRCRHSGKWHLCPVLPFPLNVTPCKVGAQKCCFPLSEMQLFKGHQRELVVCKLAVLSRTRWSVEGEVACALCEHWWNAGGKWWVLGRLCTGNCILIGARGSILCESCSTLQVRMSQVWFVQCTDPFFSVSRRKVLFETGNLLAKQCSKTGSGWSGCQEAFVQVLKLIRKKCISVCNYGDTWALCNTSNEILCVRKTFPYLVIGRSFCGKRQGSSPDSQFPTLLSAFVCLLLMWATWENETTYIKRRLKCKDARWSASR